MVEPRGRLAAPSGPTWIPLVLAGGLGERGDAVLVDDGSLVPSSSPSARFARRRSPRRVLSGALDVDELDEPWATGVRTRIHPGLFEHITTDTNR